MDWSRQTRKCINNPVRRPVTSWGRWSCAMGGALLGIAQAGSPQPSPPALSTPPAPAPAVVPSASALQQQLSARLATADCKTMPQAAALLPLQQLLHPQGLGIVVLGCPAAPAPWNQRVLAVTAVVLDGGKAQNTVRGALADGERVDMGSDYRPAPWPQPGQAGSSEVLGDDTVSPDVQFNRRWLRSVMASQGFAAVNGPWWAFIPMPQRKR